MDIRLAAKLHEELDTYLQKVHARLDFRSGEYDKFTVNGDEVTIVEYLRQCQDYDYCNFPISVLEQGIDAAVAWYKAEEKRKWIEQEEKAKQAKELATKIHEEREYSAYLRLKEKYEGNNE